MSNFIDLTGKTFERLKVIKKVGKDKWRDSMWLCKCSCELGKEVIVKGGHLKSGSIQSCGCLRKERVKNSNKLNKKYNTYDLTGEFGIGYTFKNKPFYFDLEDYDLIKDYCWCKDKIRIF